MSVVLLRNQMVNESPVSLFNQICVCENILVMLL